MTRITVYGLLSLFLLLSLTFRGGSASCATTPYDSNGAYLATLISQSDVVGLGYLDTPTASQTYCGSSAATVRVTSIFKAPSGFTVPVGSSACSSGQALLVTVLGAQAASLCQTLASGQEVIVLATSPASACGQVAGAQANALTTDPGWTLVRATPYLVAKLEAATGVSSGSASLLSSSTACNEPLMASRAWSLPSGMWRRAQVPHLRARAVQR